MNMFWNQYDTISLLPPHMDRANRVHLQSEFKEMYHTVSGF